MEQPQHVFIQQKVPFPKGRDETGIYAASQYIVERVAS